MIIMKNIFRLLLTASVFIIVFSCTEADDMASYNHSENIQYGAVLRTIEIQNSLINTSFDDSAFRVTVEEQDIEDGDLLQEMRIIAVFDDYTPIMELLKLQDLFKLSLLLIFTLILNLVFQGMILLLHGVQLSKP